MAKDLYLNLDLNLLRTFMVLYQDLNMRKAAARLSVTQPAVSQALQKLRNHFNHELFVKVAKGLEPTPFATQLAESISPHLDALSVAVNAPAEFTPKSIDYTIKIALNSTVLSCLSGALFKSFRQLAPNAHLELVNWTSATINDIKNGNVHLGVHYDIEHPKEIYGTRLTMLTGKAIVRKDHPLKLNRATLSDFEPYEIGSIIIPGWNENFIHVAEIMRSQGLKPKVGFRTEIILALLDIIEQSDMVLPHTNIFPIQNYPQLRAIDVTIGDQASLVEVCSYHHLKYRNSPLIVWLNQLITDALNKQIALSDKLSLLEK